MGLKISRNKIKYRRYDFSWWYQVEVMRIPMTINDDVKKCKKNI